ncbi:hypothetical protein DO97_11995 [Neosynechococcus sphagnicola sy1]|uniref:SPOR domain-containing protein n=2 Tax=Neosynechococcus TaxID=1501143 RepID=A0A098TMS5_9CYAN|nr:hypothetical protein DO97_11995 [Neosynechococcus sphagnicola sy1]
MVSSTSALPTPKIPTSPSPISLPLNLIPPTTNKSLPNPPLSNAGGIEIPVPPPDALSLPPTPAALRSTPTATPAMLNPPPTLGAAPVAGSILPVPNSEIPVGNGDSPPVILPPAVAVQPAALGLRYRVVVAAENANEQTLVKSLVPGAFRTFSNGRAIMQAGAFSDRAKADELLQLLVSNGLPATVEPYN